MKAVLHNGDYYLVNNGRIYPSSTSKQPGLVQVVLYPHLVWVREGEKHVWEAYNILRHAQDEVEVEPWETYEATRAEILAL